jgi:hypothetical protein
MRFASHASFGIVADARRVRHPVEEALGVPVEIAQPFGLQAKAIMR